ncbi:hypothetical protein F53441_9934 [Fusarium austroafricanum]|uniref:Cytochrome P450 monooxygenase n=1 Tax=Fusarium austroafricanum TaxID=2364996 RepID=A0A8H4P2V7_9HYPO|nr:hypothetical protein F53441_9934 [Fusarium austroafricanum]
MAISYAAKNVTSSQLLAGGVLLTLAKYPGPFWARISAFPAYWYTLKQDRHVWFWQLQQKYGPTFRIAPNSVIVNTPTGLHTIFNKKANVKKAEYYKVYPHNVHAMTTWNSIDKTMHARKRRVMNHAFSDKALRSCEPFIHANIDRWLELMNQEIGEKEWSNSLNMARWADHLIFDTLGELCFGLMTGFMSIQHPVNSLDTPMNETVTNMRCQIAFSPFASIWAWLKPRGLDDLLAASAPPALSNWQTFVQKCFAERAKAEDEMQKPHNSDFNGRKDFFHYLLQAVDPETGKGYTDQELFGESESLIIAGSDTSAIALAAAIFYLSRYPLAQEKLVEEIHSAFSSYDDIKSGPALHSCHYLRAFIDETLRMSPPVPSDLSREVEKGGIVVDGQYIPEGIKVSTAAYCMHHNPDYYPKPFNFRPERWIVGEENNFGVPTEDVSLTESAFMPFSAGPRGCVGKNLAYLEMSLALVKTVYRFEIRRDPSSNLGGGSPGGIEGRRTVDQYQLRDIFVAGRDGPMVQLAKR